jgi:hypothetical protein
MTMHPVLALIEAIDSYIDSRPLQHRELAGIRRRLKERLKPASVAALSPVPSHPRHDELQPAFALAQQQGAGDVIDRLSEAQDYLDWVSYDSYPAAEIGTLFPRQHLFTSLIALVDPNWSHDFDFGLLWIAPQTLYRDHQHAAPELYLPLTGPSQWRFSPERPWIERQAGELVWNAANVSHATLVTSAPLLCLYAWTADVDAPARVIPAQDWHQIETGLRDSAKHGSRLLTS